MKHTKGPWRYNTFVEHPEKRGGFFIYAPKRKASIAKIFTMGEYADFKSNAEEAEANARLMAQAPAMFKALQDLDDLFFDILNEFSHKQTIQISTERIAEFAEISAGALAKATDDLSLIRS